MQIRLGLNSGEVVVRAIGNDLHMDYSAVGQTTHLAGRMEQLATPGSILLTAATRRLVEGLMRVQGLGPVPVKGLTAPVDVFELIGITSLRRRLQAAATRGLSPFVGRQPELDALQQALARAGTGQGQVHGDIGDYPGAIASLQWHVARLQGELRSARFGGNSIVAAASRTYLSYCHVERGTFTEGLILAAEALQIAEHVHHPFSMIEACRGLSMLYLRQGDVKRAIPVLERASPHTALCFHAQPTVAMNSVSARICALQSVIHCALPIAEEGCSFRYIWGDMDKATGSQLDDFLEGSGWCAPILLSF